MELSGPLLGALIGAASAGWFSEWYKRFRDRKALAYALAGELASHLEGVKLLIMAFGQLISILKPEDMPQFPKFEAFDFVFDKSIEKLGLLEGDFPQRIVSAYGRIKGSRQLLQKMADDYLKEDPARRILIIRHTIHEWEVTNIPFQDSLIRDLRAVGAEGFLHSIWI